MKTVQWFAKCPLGYCQYNEHMRLSFDEVHRTAYCDTKFSEIIDSLPQGTRDLNVKQIANIQFWQMNNGVTVFPSAELVEKCANTDALGSVCGTDIRTTFPTMLFTIPRSQAFVVPQFQDDRHIGHLLVSIFDDDCPFRLKIDAGDVYSLRMPPGARHLLITVFWDERFVNSFSVPLSDKTIAETLTDVQEHFIRDELRMAGMDGADIRKEQDETARIGEWACSMVVNLLLLMQSYPDFLKVAEDRHHRPHIYRDKPKPISYIMSQVRTLLPSGIRESETPREGTHHSPNAHWRRGHWRRQPHTARWYEAAVAAGNQPREIDMPDGRKAHMVWIEPVFVGIK